MQLKIGSRDSVLAIVQARLVMDALAAQQPPIATELVTMKTTGDRILDRSLDKIGGKGLFVKELDKALLEGTVDLTVHSFKDMPMEGDVRLPILAVSRREDPRDALLLPAGQDTFDPSRPVGCSSLRRKLQLEALFPGVTVLPIRGNIQTRLHKLDNGEFGALVLACAGLNRLGLTHRIHRRFSTEEMLPAACQGILAVQGRADFDKHILDNFHDMDTWRVAVAERSFVRTLDGGCSSPVAAYAALDGEQLTLTGFYVDVHNRTYRDTITGHKNDGEQLGRQLADTMKSRCPSHEPN